jgi:hypothetical protein
MEFDHVTNRYLYPDKYIKMIPYILNKCIFLGIGKCVGKDGA